MAAKRYGQKQIAEILDAIRAGAKIADVCRKHNVSRTTIHRWQKKHRTPEGSLDGGPEPHAWQLTAPQAADGLEATPGGPRELKAENVRLKRIVVRQALQIDALEELVSLREG